MAARSGRTGRHKNLACLPIPATFKIPTCDKCGAEWLDEDTADRLEGLLEAAYRKELRAGLCRAIETIGKHASQRRLEALIGVSQGYLSKLKSHDREPSPELVSELALIARDPKRRLRELEKYWGM